MNAGAPFLTCSSTRCIMMVRCDLRSIALNTTSERPPQVSPADLTVRLLRGENVGALAFPLAYSRFPARRLIRQVPLNPNRAAVSGCSKSTLCRPTTWSVVIRDLRELYGGTAAPRGNPSTWLRDYPLTSADGPTAGLRTKRSTQIRRPVKTTGYGGGTSTN